MGVVVPRDKVTSIICSSERVMCVLTRVFCRLGCRRVINFGEI